MNWVVKMETGAGKTLCARTLKWFWIRVQDVRKFFTVQGDTVFEIAKSAFQRTLGVHAVSEFLGLPERTTRHYAQTGKLGSTKGRRLRRFSLVDVVEFALRNHSSGWLDWRCKLWSQKHPLFEFGSLALRMP